MVVVDDERSEFVRNVEGREEGFWWVYASGWIVCGVSGAPDIFRVNDNVCVSRDIRDTFEYLVDARVSAAAPFPAFNDPLVVSVGLEVFFPICWAEARDGSYEEFEAHCLSPPNVPVVRVPSWEEFPCFPSRSNDDCDTRA